MNHDIKKFGNYVEYFRNYALNCRNLHLIDAYNYILMTYDSLVLDYNNRGQTIDVMSNKIDVLSSEISDLKAANLKLSEKCLHLEECKDRIESRLLKHDDDVSTIFAEILSLKQKDNTLENLFKSNVDTLLINFNKNETYTCEKLNGLCTLIENFTISTGDIISQLRSDLKNFNNPHVSNIFEHKLTSLFDEVQVMKSKLTKITILST